MPTQLESPFSTPQSPPTSSPPSQASQPHQQLTPSKSTPLTMMSGSLNIRKEINNLRFNQENDLFSVAMESGLRVYNVDPLAIKEHLESVDVGSLAVCELLHRTNLMAIVGGGSKPKFAENTVLIWDDAKKRFVIEMTFASPVLAVRLRKDRIIVAERTRIHVFTFPDTPQKLFTIEHLDNPKGLLEVTPYPSSERQLVVFPGMRLGSIQLIDMNNTDPRMSACPMNIKAHENAIACIAINSQGTLVATGSEKGTLIRIFETVTSRRDPVIELRRGSDQAILYCINFSHDSEFLCASSDKGTVHIFAVKDTHLNKRSSLSKLPVNWVPQLQSQWALANFTVPAECACICAFGPKSTVYAICVDGSFHKYTFAADGSNKWSCTREAFEVFTDIQDEQDLF